MGLITRIDTAIRNSGIYAPDAKVERGNLRVLPLLILAGLTLGYAAIVASMHTRTWSVASARYLFAGILIFGTAYAASFILRFFGPRIDHYAGALDEREQMLRARAGHLSGFVISIFAIGGCFYLAAASVFGWWAPSQTAEWSLLGLALQAAFFTLPVLVASWLQPKPDPGE